MLAAASAAAQSAATNAAPASALVLTNITQIWDVITEAGREPQRINTEAIIYYFDPDWNCTWGESHGRRTFLPVSDCPVPLKPGQRVAFDGYVIPSRTQFVWERTSIKVLEENARPVALVVSNFSRQVAGLSGRFVSVELMVEGINPVDAAHVQIRTHSGPLPGLVHILMSTNNLPLPFREGDYVRVRGVFVPKTGTDARLQSFDLWVADRSDLEVTGSLSQDPRFGIPLTTIDQIAEGLAADTLIRIEGVVRDHQPGNGVTVWDDTGQATVESDQFAPLRRGDRIEAIGFPYQLGIQHRLRRATYRLLEKAGDSGAGDEPASPNEAVRLAARLQLLNEDQVRLRPAVQLRGVLSWSHAQTPFVYVQDASGSARVMNPVWNEGPLPPGTIVTVRGEAAFGAYVPVVTNATVRREGWRGFDAPQPVSLEQAMVSGEDGRWVEMRGFVRDVERRGELTRLNLSSSSGEFVVWAPTSSAVDSLRGTVVRIAGVCSVTANPRRQLTGIELWSPDALFIRIDEPEIRDIFATEVRTIQNLRQFRSQNELGRRVKVVGTVVLHRPGRYLYLQEGPDSVFALSRQTDRLQPGDRVEAVGFPGNEHGKFLLREVVFRHLSSGAEPAPVQLSSPETVHLDLAGRMARAEGALINTLQKQDRVQLLVRGGGGFFEAALEPVDAATAERFRQLAIGSRIALKGVYEVQSDEYGRPGTFLLLLRSWDDVAVLAEPPWWTLRRLLALLVAVATVSIVFLAWAVGSSRKNKQLRQAQQELQLLNKELEAFSYSVSHDLRAPLRSIDGFSRALLDDYGDRLDADGKENLMAVRSASQRMGQLIDDLLMLARVTRFDMHRLAFDISALAASVAKEIRATAPDRRVEFAIAPGLMANADPRLLRIVFENLLGNAWKFTGKRPDGRVEFGETERDGNTVYYVRDNGVGFDMAYSKKLFGAFQRLHAVTEFPGTGIGLATVQRIIHRHGGHIWADSAPDRGATFYFTLQNGSRRTDET